MTPIEPVAIISDIDELSEFVGIADEKTKKIVAAHIASIGFLTTEILSNDKLKKDSDEEIDEEELDKYAKKLTESLVGYVALGDILREYDVKIGFILKLQFLALVKCPESIPESDDPYVESYEEFLSHEGEKAITPLTCGVIGGFFEYSGMIFHYQTRNDEDDED